MLLFTVFADKCCSNVPFFSFIYVTLLIKDFVVVQRLCAIRGTASLPLPYKHTSTARAKKAPLVWSCRKTS